MPTEREVQRLIEVYHSYYTSETIQTRWNQCNPGNRAIYQEQERCIQQFLKVYGFLPLASKRILDVGCGSGKVLASLLDLGAQPKNLYGVDLLSESIKEARQNYPDLNFETCNAEELGFTDAHFDLVLLFTVFSSILDKNMAFNIAKEIQRVLKPGGAVIWYDFRYNNPRNPNVRGMTRAAIRVLFPNFDLHLHTITLLPPLARRLGRATLALYPALAAVPFLRTHYFGLLIKPK